MLLPDGCRLEVSPVKAGHPAPNGRRAQPLASGEADERVRCMRMLNLEIELNSPSTKILGDLPEATILVHPLHHKRNPRLTNEPPFNRISAFRQSWTLVVSGSNNSKPESMNA